MTDRTLKISTGLISLGLLATLIVKLTAVPGGMILSGLALGGMVIILIILGCLAVTWISRFFIKSISFGTIFFSTTALLFILFHCQLYSPTLKIIAPKNFSGEVSLVLSNVPDNILVLDSNGIGYINQWTFNKTYTKPIVVDADGKDLSNLCIGYNPTSFWALGKACCINGQQLPYKSFKIKSGTPRIQAFNQSKSLTDLVDLQLVKTLKTDKYTTVQSESYRTDKTEK
jgi:hypothetical protein